MSQSRYFNALPATAGVKEVMKLPRTQKAMTKESTDKKSSMNKGNGAVMMVIDSPSESTVYQTAIQPNHNVYSKRDSTSSEDNVINTSDETVSPSRLDNRNLIDKYHCSYLLLGECVYL